MSTDSELKLKGIQILVENLGEVEAERFIALLLREPFDYTEWQKKLWPDLSADELSKKAMEFLKKQKVDHK